MRKGSPRRRRRSTWRRSSSGSTPTRSKRTELSDFYFKRFRKEFRPAVVAWLATKPLKNPKAPLTPFAMPQYKLAATAEARRLDAEAEISAASVRRDIQRSSNYVLGVVLFSVSLFFAGTGHQARSCPATDDQPHARLHRLSRHADLDRDVPRELRGLALPESRLRDHRGSRAQRRRLGGARSYPPVRARPRLLGGATDHPGTHQRTPASDRHLAMPPSRHDAVVAWSFAASRLRLIVRLG